MTGYIYKIECNKTKLVYIGSTWKQDLQDRLALHVRDYHESLIHRYGKNRSMTSFRVLENNDYKIELVETVHDAITKHTLLEREKYHIQNTTCVNKVVPLRTRAEYYADNQDKIKAYTQAYQERMYFCESCQKNIKWYKKAKHFKTKGHLNNIS